MVSETVFVIPAEAGIQLFRCGPCFRRGDIGGFHFPQQQPVNGKYRRPDFEKDGRETNEFSDGFLPRIQAKRSRP